MPSLFVPFRAHGLSLGLLALSGCIGRTLTELPDRPMPATALATLTAIPEASIVAISGTQQLNAVGTTYAGAAVTAFDSILYRLNATGDTLRIGVSASGLV